jgi:hypothetical protein
MNNTKVTIASSMIGIIKDTYTENGNTKYLLQVTEPEGLKGQILHIFPSEVVMIVEETEK